MRRFPGLRGKSIKPGFQGRDAHHWAGHGSGAIPILERCQGPGRPQGDARSAAAELIVTMPPSLTSRKLGDTRRQCHLFIAEISENCPDCDDASMARKILCDLDRHGHPTTKTARGCRWRHTNGSLYQRGPLLLRLIRIQGDASPITVSSD